MKKFFLLTLLSLACMPLQTFAEGESISRRDAFILMWEAIKRPPQDVRGTMYTDVAEGSAGYAEIKYAKARGLLPDETTFRPDDALLLKDALFWLFRTRNIEPIDFDAETGLGDIAEEEHIPLILKRYPISAFASPDAALMRDEFLALMTSLDAKLREEVHEVSLYSEKFQGKGTAFGEKFNMYEFTAAHRSFPSNTIVKVTNVANGQSVVVRINDRGPYVVGRDMDLSMASFTSIADRSKGKINATIERLGDFMLVEQAQACTDDRRARRIARGVVFDQGVPRSMAVGMMLTLSANDFFAIETITHPDGSMDELQRWISPLSAHTEKEEFTFTPTTAGNYTFQFRTKSNAKRTMMMKAVTCAGTVQP